MGFGEFLSLLQRGPFLRYNILAAAAVARAKNDKSAARALFDTVGLEVEKYRLGYTKASCAGLTAPLFNSN